VPSAAWWWALAALATAGVASLGLSVRHLGIGALPGCGLESACDRAMASVWGRVPGLDWPVAHLGTAHFLGLLGAWALARGRWFAPLTGWARVGGAVSVLYLVALASLGEVCPYCLTAHAGNLAFLVLSWRQAGASGARGVVTYGIVALAITLGLVGAEASARSRDERALAESVPSAATSPEAGFTGRHRLGPEEAAVRIVLFGDFQCPDCRRIDDEALELVNERDDVSLTVKHFPLSTDCNPRARELGHNPHPNACWAARAAEAADLLGGTEAYWRLSHWLFERGGAFDPPMLETAARELGLDPAALVRATRGPETEARVQADIDEALSLGIATTPMIFLNGVELRGWQRSNALRRAVDLFARSPAARPDGDTPPGALEKCIEDWRQQPQLPMPPAGRGSEAAEAPLLVVFGDYLDPTTRELDRLVTELRERHPGLTTSFRHYPLDARCGPGVPDTHPGAALLASAYDAAWTVAGPAAAEALHPQLFGARPDPGAVIQIAREAGIEAGPFAARLEDPASLDSVRKDLEAARRFGVTVIPAVFVAGRWVPRWRFGDEPVLERIVEEALRR
jgi:predicted DsbA family dithiol-disulfide isomerase/uncharacterized membrane protein